MSDAPRLPFDPFPHVPRGTPGAYAAAWNPIQRELASRVRMEPLPTLPRFFASADCAFTPDKRSIVAVALVWDRETKQIVEQTSLVRDLDVPYVSGYLSFREGPAILDAIGRLKHDWGVVCFDGQGIAHPRRCGLAAHLGVVLDRPAVGFAKSRLIGTHAELPWPAGSTVPLVDRGEPIGVVLRTRDGVNPIYLSVGHRIDLPSAIDLAMACVTRFRLPEPTRQADKLVALEKKRLLGE